MARQSPVYYIAPSSIQITPNANESPQDIAVFVAEGAKIKVYSPAAGIGTENATYREWTLSGRNRHLAESDKPYTIYARLSKTDSKDAYLVFAPKTQGSSGWLDKYPYVLQGGLSFDTAGAATGGYWYVRLGDVSLPQTGLRTLSFDTGILGTDQFNAEWNMDPDDSPLRIQITCTIGGKDAGPSPYVAWGRELLMHAALVEGWEASPTSRVDHWAIVRNTGNDAADAAWALSERATGFSLSGNITLLHHRDDDDFGGAVSTSFTVTCFGTDGSGDGVVKPLAVGAIAILAETTEKYELMLSTSIVSYNPPTDTYSPSDGISVGIRAIDQRGDVLRLTGRQIAGIGLSASYARATKDEWTALAFDEVSDNEARAVIPVTAFQYQENVRVRILNASGGEVSMQVVAFVRDGEDSREREWIYYRSEKAVTFGGISSKHVLPALIQGGEVEPAGAAAGYDTDKDQDGWVPQGWWDEPQGTDKDNHYEYGSYRDFIHEAGTSADDHRGHWGDFTTPKVWSYFAEDGESYRVRWTLDGMEVLQLVATYTGEFKGTLPLRATLMKRKGTGKEEIVTGAAVINLSCEGLNKTYTYHEDSPELVVSQTEHEEIIPRLNDEDLTALFVRFTVGEETFSSSITVVREIGEDSMLGLLQKYGSKLFLSKVNDDEAAGVIGFLKGAWFGLKQWAIDALGNANLNSVIAENATVAKLLKAYSAVISKMQSPNYTGDGMLDTGWRLTSEYNGHSKLTVDELYVRMRAVFEELEVRKWTSIGGNFVASPASGKVWRVELYDGDGEVVGYDTYNMPWSVGGSVLGLFSRSLSQRLLGRPRRLASQLTAEEMAQVRRIRCYMYADDGTTGTMSEFTAGAQIRCQTINKAAFDVDAEGVHRAKHISNTFWWRLADAVGQEVLEDNHLHDWVEFLVNTGDEQSEYAVAYPGSDIPAVGDVMVQFGHRTRTELSNVITLETSTGDAPALKMYRHINSWTLDGKRSAIISPMLVEMSTAMFHWITSYGDLSEQRVNRGLWVSIAPDAQGWRRCYYNDMVSHNGSYWRCTVPPSTHKEDAEGRWYTQQEVDSMTPQQQMALIDSPDYTTLEPGDATAAQQAVWSREVYAAIAPYVVFSNALFAVPCEKDSTSSAAYAMSATVRLKVTNVDATITGVTLSGGDANVRLQDGTILVSFAKGAAVQNKDYTVTVDGTLNGQRYVATDKISVYAVVRGSDAYEISSTPVTFIFSQAMDEPYNIILDGVETVGGKMSNCCAQLTVVNDGAAQPFQIVSVTCGGSKNDGTSVNGVQASYNNTTGRVWFTSIPNDAGSGYADVTVRYGNNASQTIRVSFYCNLLGTWNEKIVGDTRQVITERTEYYIQKNEEALETYQQNLAEATSELNDVITTNEAARDETDQIMKDGLITDDEKGVLRSLKKNLQTEYNEAVAAYTPVYNNANLDGTDEKTALATAKTNMDTAYNAVIAKIDELLALTKIDKDGADAVNTTFTNFDNKLKAYRTALENASNKIVSAGDSALNTAYTEFHAEYEQSSAANTQKFEAITGILGEDGSKIVTQTEFGTYKQSAAENLATLERNTNTALGNKVETSTFNQTVTNIGLSVTTAENNAKSAAQGYANTAEGNAKSYTDSAVSNRATTGYVDISSDNVRTGVKNDLSNTGIDITNGKIHLRADKVTFENSAGTVSGKIKIDTSTGTLEANSAKLTGQLLIQDGSSDGLKLDSNGNILRYNKKQDAWFPFYAGRAVRGVYTGGNSQTIVLDGTDDMVLVRDSGGIIRMPASSSVYDGKVLTIRNIAGGTNQLRPNTGQTIRDTDGSHGYSGHRDLNNDERAELVYFGTVWYLNVIGT